MRNSYPDGKGVRSLPDPPAAQQHDWMQRRMLVGEEELKLNYSEAVLSLDIVRPRDSEKELQRLATTLYRDMAAALAAADASSLQLLPSVDMLDVYQKYTDDRVLAALELELSGGNLIYPGGKQQWLRDLQAAIPVDNDPARMQARAFLAAAIELGGGRPPADPKIAGISSTMLQRFRRNPVASTVIGFYSSSDSLSQIYKRDRFLQCIAGSGSAHWFATDVAAEQLAMMREIDNALSGSIPLRDAYNDFLALQSDITNPPGTASLNELSGGAANAVAVFPHSRSLEEKLFGRMQPGQSPMEMLRQALLDGSVSLEPQSDSGWYDRQQYELESLLLTERAAEFAKLDFSPSYLARLEQAFEATITQRRETQAKNLAVGNASSAPSLADQPLLHLEPAPTVYLRTSRAYRFLHDRLAALPGEGSGTEQMQWLKLELAAAARRYLAMHCLSCNDLGLQPGFAPMELEQLEGLSTDGIEPDELGQLMIANDPRFDDRHRLMIAALVDEAQDWLQLAIIRDQQYAASMSYDPRVCVPAAQASGKVLNWGVIGVRLLLLESSFRDTPQLQPADSAKQQEVDSLLMRKRRMLLPVYEYASFETAAPVGREQFRDWCNQSRSREEFRLVVNAYGGSVGRSWLEQYGIWVILLICVALFRDRLFPAWFGEKKKAEDDEPQDAAGDAGGTS